MLTMHLPVRVEVMCRSTMCSLRFRVASITVSLNLLRKRYVFGCLLTETQMLLSLASSINSVPLPPVSNRHGIRLPPPEHCLVNVNFNLVPNPPHPQFGDGILPPKEDTQDFEPTSQPADTIMQDVSQTDSAQGTKRTLEEDEDYD